MHDKILMRYTDAQGLHLLVPSKSAVETASNNLRARMCCLDVQLLATMIAGCGCGTLAPPRRQ